MLFRSNSKTRSDISHQQVEQIFSEAGITKPIDLAKYLNSVILELEELDKKLKKYHFEERLEEFTMPSQLVKIDTEKNAFQKEFEGLTLRYQKVTDLMYVLMLNDIENLVIFTVKEVNKFELRQLFLSFVQKHNEVKKYLWDVEHHILQYSEEYTYWNEVLDVLLKTREGIQISLQRIAELAGLSEQATEKTLKKIIAKKEIGNYYELEQTFLRGKVSLSQIEDMKVGNFNSKKIEALQTCTSCGDTQSLLIRKCTECGNQLPSCEICKRGFSKSDNLITCPHCSRKFHKSHFLEVVRIQGKCPACKTTVR